MPHAIGLDIGHSAVKVAIGETFLFPTAAMPALDLSIDGSTEAAQDDTVRIGSGTFFVGETAKIHSGGRLLDGLSDDWTVSDEHTALMVAGYQKAVRRAGVEPDMVVLGLPSRLHSKHKAQLQATAAVNLGISRLQIRVMPQPMAAYYSRIVDAEGMPTGSVVQDDKWIIIDVGYYTTDFGMFASRRWSSAAQESTSGVYLAAQHLRRLIADRIGMDVSVREAEAILRTKAMRHQGEIINASAWVAESVSGIAKSIVDAATRILGSREIDSASGVFIAGGGSSLVFEALHKQWRHAVCAENPRFAVAEGLRRYGLASLLVMA